MIVVTTEDVASHRVTETLGQCIGVVVRSPGAEQVLTGRSRITRAGTTW